MKSFFWLWGENKELSVAVNWTQSFRLETHTSVTSIQPCTWATISRPPPTLTLFCTGWWLLGGSGRAQVTQARFLEPACSKFALSPQNVFISTQGKRFKAHHALLYWLPAGLCTHCCKWAPLLTMFHPSGRHACYSPQGWTLCYSCRLRWSWVWCHGGPPVHC